MPSEPVKCHLVTHKDGCRHLIPNLSPMTVSEYEAVFCSVVACVAIPATDYAALLARATAAEERVRVLEEALAAWQQYDSADPMVKGECLREARERTALSREG